MDGTIFIMPDISTDSARTNKSKSSILFMSIEPLTAIEWSSKSPFNAPFVIPSTFKAIFPSRLDSLCTLPSLNRTAPVASLMTILPSNDFLSFFEDDSNKEFTFQDPSASCHTWTSGFSKVMVETMAAPLEFPIKIDGADVHFIDTFIVGTAATKWSFSSLNDTFCSTTSPFQAMCIESY